MANLKEFNFRHQTAAPLESHRPLASTCPGLPRASELASCSQREEEEDGEIISGGLAGMQGGRWLKTSKQNSLSTRRVTLVRLRPRGGSMASK